MKNLSDYRKEALEAGLSEEKAQQIAEKIIEEQFIKTHLSNNGDEKVYSVLKQAKNKLELTQLIERNLPDASQEKKDEIFGNMSNQLNLKLGRYGE